jgi:hypothetical protein
LPLYKQRRRKHTDSYAESSSRGPNFPKTSYPDEKLERDKADDEQETVIDLTKKQKVWHQVFIRN